MTTESVTEPGPGLQVEQRASTSTVSIRAVITSQVHQLGLLLQRGLSQLSSRHQHRLRDAAAFRVQIGSVNAPSSEEVAQGLQIVDDILVELLTRARRHSRNQLRIRKLIEEIQQKDESLKRTIRRLSVLRDRCSRLVQLGEEEIEAMDRAEKHPITYDEILDYARKLSQTTTAPPGFQLQLDEEEVGEEGKAEGMGQTNKSLYQGESDPVHGKSGRVPPHLQEKLPFPSENALRRSVMNMPLMNMSLLTWETFQRGVQRGQEEDPLLQESVLNAEQSRPFTATNNRPKAVAEDEDDGFGLDLN